MYFTYSHQGVIMRSIKRDEEKGFHRNPENKYQLTPADAGRKEFIMLKKIVEFLSDYYREFDHAEG